MAKLNRTRFDDQHHTIILSSKRATDHTGLYVLLLLSILLFILLFYLFYNFISYKRHSYSQKNKKKSILDSTQKLNHRLSVIMSESMESKKAVRATSRGDIINPTEKLSSKPAHSSQPPCSSSTHPNFVQTKYFIRNQYESPIQRVSHL